MRQISLATEGFEKYRKTTKKELFLKQMDEIIPWKELSEVIEPYYPKPEGAGRKPIGVEKMLRIHFLQHWFQLSDPGAEESLYDSRVFREFAGIDLGEEPVPDETTILKFRHLLESRNLGSELFVKVNEYLHENGIKVYRGTIVDATIIEAPSSTKNIKKERDPEMKQTKKGNQWHFGMKTHIGVDSHTKLIHSVVVTAANVHDSQVLEDLLHGEETRVWGDSAYCGQREKISKVSPYAKSFIQKKGSRNKTLTGKEREQNRNKSRIRAKVEHVFHVLKRQFGYQKVRYRGLDKNANHVFVSCALVNIVMAKRQGLSCP